MLLTGETVVLHVKERKKWKKYPCCLRDHHFILFKDAKVISNNPAGVARSKFIYIYCSATTSNSSWV
jgi:hypothetical protein